MQINRKIGATAAAIGVIAAGGAGIAYAVGGDSEEQVGGAAGERAKDTALRVAGGGTVTEVERQESGGAGFYEVEVQRADGSQVEIHLDDRFQPVGTAADDDRGAEDEGGADDDGSADDD
jgi:hypothetical protein